MKRQELCRERARSRSPGPPDLRRAHPKLVLVSTPSAITGGRGLQQHLDDLRPRRERASGLIRSISDLSSLIESWMASCRQIGRPSEGDVVRATLAPGCPPGCPSTPRRSGKPRSVTSRMSWAAYLSSDLAATYRSAAPRISGGALVIGRWIGRASRSVRWPRCQHPVSEHPGQRGVNSRRGRNEHRPARRRRQAAASFRM